MLELFMNIFFFSFIPFQLHPHSLPPPPCKLLLTFWNLFWLLPALIQLPTVCVYHNTSEKERKNKGKKEKKKLKSDCENIIILFEYKWDLLLFYISKRCYLLALLFTYSFILVSFSICKVSQSCLHSLHLFPSHSLISIYFLVV